MNKDDNKDSTKPMSLLSLILSFMALFVISSLLFLPVDHETRQVLIGLDFLICSVFIIQLTIDMIRATDRVQFLKKHWIDYVASIPLIEPLRYARIFQILRVILLLRSSQNIAALLTRNRTETTLASIILLMVVLMAVGSSVMLFLEGPNPESNIDNAGDAMWWALVTISTVGYGDHYPVTDSGKLLAAGLIVSGVGLFGMISGLITSLITSPTKQQESRSENKERLLIEITQHQTKIIQRLEAIEDRLEQLEKKT
ncbi:potassium channel family protein [Vibrio mexicanus]|uniref:potassium channel family protein n=1 Tax=Vibrio mexicanus TaxID=1004326 RepID=UPI00063C2911|nr:potassium channel family protein [Vibrio mexicanus]